MSHKDICLFWQIVESLVRSSEICCGTFVQSDGLRYLILTLTYCSSYEVNRSIVRVVGHVATTKGLKEALQRQEVLSYLELIAGSSCYKDKEVLE